MSTEKKIFSLRPRSRSLATRWYLQFEINGKLYKRYGDINSYETRGGRLEAAERLRTELKIEFYNKVFPIKDRLYKLIDDRKLILRKKTYQTYISKLDVFFEWLGSRGVEEETILEFFYWIQSTRSANTYMKYVHLFKKLLKEEGLGSLMNEVKHLRIQPNSALYFQKHQVLRLKNRIPAKYPDLWFCCQLLYYCFIRPGEQRMMKVNDILFDDWKIRMRAEITKNKKTQFVTIPVPFRAEIKNLMERGPNEWLFPDLRDGTKPIGPNTMNKRHRKILNEAGFSVDHKLYSWKHTGAVACVKAGISLKELQIQLRHHSLKEVDEYLKQLGVYDLERLEADFPPL